MKVQLKRDWFAPNAVLYEKHNNPHDFPDDWEAKLPKGAVMLAKRDAKAIDKADEAVLVEETKLSEAETKRLAALNEAEKKREDIKAEVARRQAEAEEKKKLADLEEERKLKEEAEKKPHGTKA